MTIGGCETAVHEAEVVQCKLEEQLRVGLPALVQFDPEKAGAARHKTAVRGWQVQRYITLDRPRNGNELEAIKLHLQQDCVVRFLTPGLAIGFRSGVLDFGFSRIHPQVSLLWPSQIMSLPTREVMRAPVDLPVCVELTRQKPLEGRLRNLSPNGFRIALPVALKVGAEAAISCKLSERHEVGNCAVTVLACTPEMGQYAVRMKLQDRQPVPAQAMLDFLREQGADEAA